MDIKQRTGIAAGEYKRRRRQLMDMAGEDAILVLPAAAEKVRSLDTLTRSARIPISST
jgi:Xaa-Pro aminopeptidase